MVLKLSSVSYSGLNDQSVLMMPLGEAHEGADGNPLYVLLMRFTLPALELKMMRLDSVLEHTDIGPCGAPV
ncbi:hypothetical protein Nepgr_021049 [Nepenthes gracilis]|uniref:Uncharacterized protein n=1 Tax=Nepenthes gracilis TaxID=150966 RepID=A0AAD3SXA5_NEPGR|nr:hypothetical protein Nepgr_021049 [Nepenthes gracilis]